MQFRLSKQFLKISFSSSVIEKRLISLFELIAERAFQVSIAAIFIAAMLGFALVALQYRTLSSREVILQQNSIRFSWELYQQVRNELEEREKTFEATDKKEYPNLFVPAGLTRGEEKVK
jgi:hypothetical protein